MSIHKNIETRSWSVPGIEPHTITVEWTRRTWTPPESVVKVDGEIVSVSTFWSRHMRYGVHAFRLNDNANRQAVLKYHDKEGYHLFVDDQRISPIEEHSLVTASAG